MKRWGVMMGICSILTIANGQLPGIKYFSIQLRDWSGNFSGDFQSKRRNLSGAEFNGASSRNAFLEEVKFNGDGYLYHPNLYQFAYGIGLGFNQSSIRWSGESDPYSKDSGWVREMLYQSMVLPKKPYGLYIGYNRKYRRLNNNFFEDTESTSSGWTYRTSLRDSAWNVQGSYSTDSRNEYFGLRQVNVDEKRLNIDGAWGDRKSLNGTFRAGYTRSLREDVGLYKSDQKNTILQGRIVLPFDEIGEKAVSSSIIANSITSRDDILNITWTNLGRTKLRPKLFANGKYLFRYYENGPSILRSHTLEGAINHQLYESLFSNGTVIVNSFIEESFRRTEIKLPLNVDYQKNLPAGHLTANVGWQPNMETIRSPGGTLVHLSQVHRFSDQFTLILSGDNIQEESITITSLDEMILYLRDRDYRVTPYGNGFEIMRISGGAIQDSVEILVKYIIKGKATQRIGYTNWTYGVGYSYQSFWGIRCGYTGDLFRGSGEPVEGFSTQDNKRDSGWYISVDYAPFTFEASRHRSNSKLTPYTNNNISIKGIRGSHLNQYIMVNAQYTWEELPLRNDYQEIRNLMIEGFRRFSRSIRGKIAYGERNINGTLNDIVEKKWQGVVKYQTRMIAFSLNYQLLENTLFKDKETDHRVFIELEFTP